MRRYQLVPPPGGLPTIIDELARAAGEAVPGSEGDARRVAEVLFAGRVRQSDRCGGLVECAELGPPVLVCDARPLVSMRPMLLVDLDARDLPFLFAAVLVDELGGEDREQRERRLQAVFTSVVGPYLFEHEGCGRAPGCEHAKPLDPFRRAFTFRRAGRPGVS